MAEDPKDDDHFGAREGLPTGEHHEMTPEEEKARHRRNLLLALGVVTFIALVYLTTLLRMAQNVGGVE